MELCSPFSHTCKLEEADRVLTQHLRSTRKATLAPDARYYRVTQSTEAIFLIQREKDANRKKSALEERHRAIENERTRLVERLEVESRLRMRWAESYIHSIIQGQREAAEYQIDSLLEPTTNNGH